MPTLLYRQESRRAVCGMLATLSVLASANRGTAEEVPAAQISGSDVRVSFQRRDAKLLLHASEAATAFGWEAKVVSEGRLLTLCREGAGGLCVPVQLDNVVSVKSGADLFVDAAALARPLRFRVRDVGGIVLLVPQSPAKADDPEIPAYNSAWGEGRGFRVGQTLPDIPLFDLEGREVRFSRFLGQQYIIYCWASW